MITKEVNEWFAKVEKGNYSSWDIMEEFARITKHLSKEDLKLVQKRLHTHIKH